MTTLRQTGLATPAQHAASEQQFGGHIRVSSKAGANASGTSGWRCGAGLSSDHGVRLADSIAAARALDAKDRA